MRDINYDDNPEMAKAMSLLQQKMLEYHKTNNALSQALVPVMKETKELYHSIVDS